MTASAGLGGDESGTIGRWLGEAAPWLVVVSFFLGFGLLLAFTPCVFPMLPIVSGIIVGAGDAGLAPRPLVLSLAYVFGMAVAHAAAGVAAGLSGTLLAAALQNAWVLGGMAVLFVALALSMFGVYELQLPSAWQSQVTEEASPGISGPVRCPVWRRWAPFRRWSSAPASRRRWPARCSTSDRRDALLGGVALFFMALGMGVPLVAVGASAGALLPQAGAWMDGVKEAFGVALLATAWSLLAPVLPPAFCLGGWAVLCIVTAIWLRAIDPLPVHAPGGCACSKAWPSSCCWWGACSWSVLFRGRAIPGVRWPACGRRRLRPSCRSSGCARWPSLRRGLAPRGGRCSSITTPTGALPARTWSVRPSPMTGCASAWQAGSCCRSTCDGQQRRRQGFACRFGLFGPPGIVFFDARGVEVPNVQVVGFQNADAFLRTLALAAPDRFS